MFKCTGNLFAKQNFISNAEKEKQKSIYLSKYLRFSDCEHPRTQNERGCTQSKTEKKKRPGKCN